MHTKTIGLTGSSGSLGARIATLLERQSDITLVPFGGDLRSESDLRDWVSDISLNTVVLSGAIVPVLQASQFPEDTFEVNALSNLKIASLMHSIHGDDFRICFISSSHVYAHAKKPLTEESTLQPASIYGKSKLLGEKLLQSAADVFGFELLIARVFSFYSEDQHEAHLYPTLLRRFATHTDAASPFELPGWNNVRDFSSADEIAEKLVSLATSRLTGVVNVGSGKGMTVGDFANQVYGSNLVFREEDVSTNPTRIVADVSRFEEWTRNSL